MPALERRRSAAPLRNAQEIGAPVLWIALAAVSLFPGILYFAAHGGGPAARLAVCSVLALLWVCLALSLVSQRYFWWAPRIIAGLLAFGCFAGVYLTAWYPPELARDPRLPAVFMVTVCFLVMGVPALCFMLWGHSGGKLARLDARRVTTMDLWTARLLVALRYALFMAVAFYLVRLLYLEMVLYPG